MLQIETDSVLVTMTGLIHGVFSEFYFLIITLRIIVSVKSYVLQVVFHHIIVHKTEHNLTGHNLTSAYYYGW